ncbi:MAG: adenylate/guanylate cyclase domain-containing protein [Actinomycetota bacterium]
MAHPVRYAEVDGLHLAYQVIGEGPIDLVLVDEWATPLEARWEVPAIAGRLNRLSSFARVISFDKRGIGLSDAGDRDLLATPELWVRDVVAVVDAAGAERPVILGAHEGGPIAMMYAASLPERTEALILVDTGPRLVEDPPGYPFGIPVGDWRPDREGIVDVWQSGDGGTDHIPATARDPWLREWYARSRRQQATPAVGLALMQMIGQLDVRSIVGSITAPTQIIHRRGSRWWPIEGARWLAERLPDNSLTELDGEGGYWWAGDADRVIDEIEQCLIGQRVSMTRNRSLATMVFTDVVDSTRTTAALGDRAWRELLDVHDDLTIDHVERHGGTVVKNLGDGFLLTFEGPAAAIRACRQLQTALARHGLPVRISVHTGEVEHRGADLTGLAVNLTARMLDVADGGEIVASGVVRGLVAGSGIRFEAKGDHCFKGIPEEWDVHAVVDDAMVIDGA